MLKVVVFDGGWGGEVVADYLAGELKTVEITRATDWQHLPYEEKTLPEIFLLAQEQLEPYLGKVDLIVLGGYLPSAVIGKLRESYPEQKFVGVSINYHAIPSLHYDGSSRIVILMDEQLRRTPLWNDIRRTLPYSTIIVPDCTGWEGLIDLGEMSPQVLRYELQEYFALSSPRPLRPNQNSNFSSIPSSPAAHGAPSPQKLQILRFLNLEPPRRLEFPAGALNDSGELIPHCQLQNPIQADCVLVLNTHFWGIKDMISEVFGESVPIIDFREQLRYDVCRTLGLRGADGYIDRGHSRYTIPHRARVIPVT